MEKMWNKISPVPADGLSLLELCGADWKWACEAKGSMLVLQYSHINNKMPFSGDTVMWSSCSPDIKVKGVLEGGG